MLKIFLLVLLFKFSANAQFNFWQSLLISAPPHTWPVGTDGDLIINSGQTVDLSTLYPGRTIFDFNNVEIKSGGTLILPTVNSLQWIIFGVNKNFIVNGTINGQGKTRSVGGSISSLILPNELAIPSQTLIQKNGGSGGRGGGTPNILNSTSLGGAGCSSGTNAGVGGGGGGGFGDVLAFDSRLKGGAGGTCGSNGAVGTGNRTPTTPGGVGNATLGNGSISSPQNYGGNGGGSGGGGGGYSSGAILVYDGGGGGGGGYRGAHGSLLLVYVKNNFSGSGIINLQGANGFVGASGSNASSGYANGGGGGGGGAGGSGGIFLIHSLKNNQFLGSVLISGGVRGAGGNNGASCTINSHYCSPSYAPLSGSAGEDGALGIYQFIQQ